MPGLRSSTFFTMRVSTESREFGAMYKADFRLLTMSFNLL